MPEQLLKMLESYIQGRITLSYFEGWFIANRQSLLESGDNRVAKLARKVDDDLARFSEGTQRHCIRESFYSYLLDNK